MPIGRDRLATDESVRLADKDAYLPFCVAVATMLDGDWGHWTLGVGRLLLMSDIRRLNSKTPLLLDT